MSNNRKKTKPANSVSKMHAPTQPAAEEVGYGKPPTRTQFQPGQSGNPKGRPKGVKNLATNVRTVLGRKITVLEHGRRKSVSAAEAILHRYLELAIKGDVKAGAFLLSLFERFQPTEAEETAAGLSEEDKAIVANLFKKIGKQTEG